MNTIIFIIFLFFSCLNLSAQRSIVFFEDYESPLLDSGYIDTMNAWYIGRPAKTVFDSAYSGNRAIYTDTSFYRTNASSSFYLDFTPPFYNCYGCLSFWHKYYTAPGKDGGYIEVSYDSSSVWTNVIFDSLNEWTYMQLMYSDSDTITGGIPSFTGTQNIWTSVSICWTWWIAIKTGTNFWNSFHLRFTFSSDSVQDNLEGWIIDDITVEDAGPWGCSSVEEYGLPAGMMAVYPSIASEEVTIYNKNHLKLSRIEIIDSRGAVIHDEKWQGDIKQIVDLSKLPAGIAIIRITDDRGNSLNKRMVKCSVR